MKLKASKEKEKELFQEKGIKYCKVFEYKAGELGFE